MKLIKKDEDYFLVNTKYLNGLESIITFSGRKLIASTQKLDNLPLLDKKQIEKHLLNNDAWRIGNRLRVTTIYDHTYYDRDNYVDKNDGKQIYEGIVIEKDKGMALLMDNGLSFMTQGGYWFGSILNQDVEIIGYNLSPTEKRWTDEDVFNYIEWSSNQSSIQWQEWVKKYGNPPSREAILNEWVLVQQKRAEWETEYDVEVEMEKNIDNDVIDEGTKYIEFFNNKPKLNEQGYVNILSIK